MDFNVSILLVVYIILGIILLSMSGYMYDTLNKNGYFEKKYKSDIFDAHRMLLYFTLSPIMFIYFGIKNKSRKYFILSFIFYLIIIIALFIGINMIK